MATKTRRNRFGAFKQFRQAYDVAKVGDPKIGLILAGCFFAVFALFVALGIWAGHPYYLGFLGLLFAFLVTLIVFSRRANRSAFAQIEGRMGAAWTVLDTFRRGWTMTRAVAATMRGREIEAVVHRAVGRCGVVLVGEGSPSRLPQLLGNEKRKTTRLLGESVPVYEIIAGSGEGQVPLSKLQRKMMRLPRKLTRGQVDEVNNRLRALPSIEATQNLPKGPMPKSLRVPRGRR